MSLAEATPLDFVLIAMIIAAASGLPGLLARRASAWPQAVAAAAMVLSAVLGSIGAWSALFSPPSATLALPWPAVGGAFLGLDALSAFFLVLVFLAGGLGSIYGLGYWPQAAKPRTARRLQLFWGLLVAGMALLLCARHAYAFLLGWEAMALAAFFLIGLEDDRAECRRAGLVYLVATHVGTLALLGLFLSWRAATGSFALEPARAGAMSVGAMNGLFLLALLGFGTKAGTMPLHFWLPGAHANAPSHVSAMLSGVVLKMGIYGLARFAFLVPDPPPAWGGALVALGAASGILGVAFALGQHDLKRLLAYHSVENIGIILMGLGLACLGRSYGRPELVALGLGGCLLHVWNHGLFKTLLFLGAGSVVKAAGTREIDLLGGLAKPMPWTSAFFLVGAAAICGLPPLNGFASELLVYLGLFGSLAGEGGRGAAAAVAAPALAMIGALAVACFVKAYGAVFLGTARSPRAEGARESPPSMLLPMALIGASCALIGLAPILVAPVLDRAVAAWSLPGSRAAPGLASLAPLGALSAIGPALLAAIALLWLAVARKRRLGRSSVTWDCGYARPTARMQYTSSSFAKTIVEMFAWVLRPREREPLVAGAFPDPSEARSEVDDLVLDRALLPANRGAERVSAWFRRFQRGLTQHYLLYILVALVVMLSTLVPFERLAAYLGFGP